MPKFSTKIIIDYNELKKYSMAINYKNKNYYFVIFGVCLVCYLLLMLLLENAVYPLAIFVAVPLLNHVGILSKVNKNYKAASSIGVIEQKVDFYDDYMSIGASGSKVDINYSDVAKVIETKTNFYLMQQDNSGVIVSKESSPSGLIDFIKNLKVSK